MTSTLKFALLATALCISTQGLAQSGGTSGAGAGAAGSPGGGAVGSSAGGSSTNSGAGRGAAGTGNGGSVVPGLGSNGGSSNLNLGAGASPSSTGSVGRGTPAVGAGNAAAGASNFGGPNTPGRVQVAPGGASGLSGSGAGGGRAIVSGHEHADGNHWQFGAGFGGKVGFQPLVADTDLVRPLRQPFDGWGRDVRNRPEFLVRRWSQRLVQHRIRQFTALTAAENAILVAVAPNPAKLIVP